MTDKFRFAATYPVYEHGVPVHRLPLAWGSTTALVQLRSWLDGLAVGTEVER